MSTHVNHLNTPRIGWVDFSKGLCIILVVLLNTSYGVEKATGAITFFNSVNEWARPFRMPDFFLLSGLFLARRINRPWRSYIDTKILHFAYYYILWMSVWYLVRIPVYINEMGLQNTLWLYPLSYIQPLGSLWFIYLLAVFFAAAKLLHRYPVWLVWCAAAILHSLDIETGWRVMDEFAARFVYFYSGFVFAPFVFSAAAFIRRLKSPAILTGLVIWAVTNAFLVFGGWGQMPVLSLILGYAGTGAIIATGVLASKTRLGEPLRYLGANTLVVFLSYFLFSVATRLVLLKTGIVTDPAAIIVLATIAGVIGPLIADRLTRNTPLAFIYKRPEMFKLKDAGGSSTGGQGQAARLNDASC